MLKFRNFSKAGMGMTAVGVALLGLTLSGAAMAQDRHGMMDRNDMMTDTDFPDPATWVYPIASPGGIDLYHFESYRGNILSPGSVTEARMENERRMEMRMHRSPIKEDELMVDPATWVYPIASPGGIDLYHFESYRDNILVEGSASEARMEKERARDARIRRETRFTDDESMADPSPWQYPIAPPGGRDLYHWRTYRQDVLSPGSATDKREENEMKRDARRKMDSQDMNK